MNDRFRDLQNHPLAKVTLTFTGCDKKQPVSFSLHLCNRRIWFFRALQTALRQKYCVLRPTSFNHITRDRWRQSISSRYNSSSSWYIYSLIRTLSPMFSCRSSNSPRRCSICFVTWLKLALLQLFDLLCNMTEISLALGFSNPSTPPWDHLPSHPNLQLSTWSPMHAT